MIKRIVIIVLVIFGIFNMELKAQDTFIDYPTSKKVKFYIKAQKEYFVNQPIKVKLFWKNESNKVEKIMIYNYWEHPLGVSVSIKNMDNEELTKYHSSHFLSSKLFSANHFKQYEINLKPNEIKEYVVDLLKIPTLKSKNSFLPKGKYRIQVFYYSMKSDEVEIEVKNE